MLALAEMLHDDFECHFVIHTPLPGLRELILRSCASIVDLGDLSLEEELKYLLDFFKPDDVIVLDGYTFKTEYQQQLKNKGHVLACIDDLQAYHFVADVVINPAGGVDLSRYSGEAYTKFLCGPAYALLKPPYLEAARKRGMKTVGLKTPVGMRSNGYYPRFGFKQVGTYKGRKRLLNCYELTL